MWAGTFTNTSTGSVPAITATSSAVNNWYITGAVIAVVCSAIMVIVVAVIYRKYKRYSKPGQQVIPVIDTTRASIQDIDHYSESTPLAADCAETQNITEVRFIKNIFGENSTHSCTITRNAFTDTESSSESNR
jgi:mannitol-specific phosphotransferase system IIBC component